MPRREEDLIKEIRERYAYATQVWKKIRAEGDLDMKCVSGDPWDDAEKALRDQYGRPHLSLDEISQYTNQAINNWRENKRGIKVEAGGSGATDQSAEFLQNLIRGIETKCSAPRSAYVPAMENILQRSYGFIKVTRQYVGATFDQEIRIEGVLNPDSVTPSPDVKKADWSDMEYCFVAEPMAKAEFKRQYPGARVTDFTHTDAMEAPDWVREDHVVLAEYHKVVTKDVKLYLVDNKAGPVVLREDELAGLRNPKVLKERTHRKKSVKKYITNGIEILEDIDQPGTMIPIVAFIGKELYIRGERKILSLVRLARDPFMFYCYLRSMQAEEAKQTPKAPFVGYKGQFESDESAWKNLSEQPRAYVQIDPIVDAATGQVLPMPSRPQYEPNFQQTELVCESARRAIQAAMGISPLPTAAQRNNEKSGVALNRIAAQEAIGSFHFTDNMDRGLEVLGKILMEWIPVVHDVEQEVGIRKPDDTHEVVRINTDEPQVGAKGQQYHYRTDVGDHDVTITTGPSYQSQREEAAEFLDKLIQNLQTLPVPPAQQAKILSLAIKMRDLGPKGDEIAQIIDPEDQAQQQGQQAIQQLQQSQVIMQKLQEELGKLQLEKQAKVVEQQGRVELEKIKQDAAVQIEKLKMELQLAIAEVAAKTQESATRQQMESEVWQQLHGDAHDLGMQKDQQAHEADQAQQAQAAAAQQQASTQQQEQPQEAQ